MRALGLLHIDQDESLHVNLKSENPLDVYVSNAVLLAHSVAAQGLPFCLVTNNRPFVVQRLAALGAELPAIEEVDFRIQVPKGIPFHGSHFKLDLFRMIGERQFGDAVAVIDIDAVMLTPLDTSWLAPDTLMVYDITSQMLPSLGAQKMEHDLHFLSGVSGSSLRWIGGEFFCGSSKAFHIFNCAVQEIWPKYCSDYNQVHVSDETVMSAALRKASSLQILDGGARRAVARWWTARTDHRQVPFSQLRGTSVLHLPSDKPFLAQQTGIPFDPAAFFARYASYAKTKLRGRRFANWVDRALLKPSRHVGVVG